MNALQQQFELISSDLARYGHINAAMESTQVLDLGHLRSEYTDLYHRYVTMQPQHFKRTNIAVGMENGMVTAAAVAGAALLLGILYKVSKWIADFFFGGSSDGGSGGGGGGGRVAAIQTDLRTDKSITAIKAVKAILDKGEHAKPTEKWLKTVPYMHVLVMSGKELNRFETFTKEVISSRRNSNAYQHANRELTQLYVKNYKNNESVLEGSSVVTNFESEIQKFEEMWGKVADIADDLKRLGSEGSVPDISNMSLKQIAHNLEQFANKMMTGHNVDCVANVAAIQEDIKVCEGVLEDVAKKENKNKNDDIYVKMVNKEIVALRRELKCMQMLALIVGAYVPFSIKELCSSVHDYKDIFNDSESAELAAIAKTLSDKQDK